MGVLELGFAGLSFVTGIAGLLLLGLAVFGEDVSQIARHKGKVIGTILVMVGVVLLMIPSAYVVVDAGTVGVQNTFGIVDTNVLDPGLHFKNPFTEIIPMNTRTQKYMDYGSSDKAIITALSHDGLQTTMGIAVNFHLNPSKIPEIFKQVGTDYSSIVMVNPIHSVPRDLISKYDTKTLYSASQEGTTDRAKLEQELYQGITTRMDEIGVRDSIIIEQVSIRDIDFPEVYKTSISNKMKMDTEIQEKQLEVRKQEMEAQRVKAEAEGTANKARVEAQGKADAMRIEAQGIADANAKVSMVTDKYISLYYLQTMKDNPKAIYIPIGQDGLPIMRMV